MNRSGTFPNGASPGLDAGKSSLDSTGREAAQAPSVHLDTQPPKWISATTSLTASPIASREPSPTRPSAKTRTSRTAPSTPAIRSRRNSAQDPSPPRTKSNNSTVGNAATSRQLSAAKTPSLAPPSQSEPAIRAPVPRKPSSTAGQSKDVPRWPVSNRLKSPPPALSRPAAAQAPSQSSKRHGPESPAMSAQRPGPSQTMHEKSEPSSQAASENDGEDAVQLASGMRTPARGPSGGLETVQESSQPNSPGPDLDSATEKLSAHVDGPTKPDIAVSKQHKSGPNGANSESGSETGSVKASARNSSTPAPPPLLHSRQSSTALKFVGGKGHTTGETSSKNIMVEEEEVNSIPRVALGLAPTAQGVNGSLKTKPSSETIRPRKEKKKSNRKQPSVASGTGEPSNPYAPQPLKLRHYQSTRSIQTLSCPSPSKTYGQGSYVEEVVSPLKQSTLSRRSPSITVQMTHLLTGGPRTASSKADIFEAKVASAVEEANSSDSDETFVYDSNPPDVSDRPRRYHSRTPSATSMISQVDRNGLRSIHSMLDSGPPNMAVRKNMKFVNTYNSNGTDSAPGDDDGRGTGGRSNAGSARGTGRAHHHHHGRWGRNGNTHTSIFDNESPFPNVARSKLAGNTSRQSSNPTSPRFATRPGGSGGKRQFQMANNYDLDDTTTGADDERTPLLFNGTRSIRSNRSRRVNYPARDHDLESRVYRQSPSFLNRFASCLVLTIMLLLVITGAIGFMFATSQPLTEIQLIKIGNILASEQELMMDITVKAHNPNVVVVTIDSADLEVFAKSRHSGTDSEWWHHPPDNFPSLAERESGRHEDDDYEEHEHEDDDHNHNGHKHGDHHDDDDDADDPPRDDDKAPNMRLGNIVDFDSPLTFEGSFFQSGISVSSGELRLARPGNGTDGGFERWERIISDEFVLIIKGVLKYTLPLSQRVRSVPISGKTTVKPNSANDPTLRPNGTVGIS